LLLLLLSRRLAGIRSEQGGERYSDGHIMPYMAV
jgi:hypothetical protein